MNDGATEDQLRLSDLTPALGGRWSGLLFDNPSIGLKPWLSWSFWFPFEEVDRGYDSSSVSLSIEWVPLSPATWRDMAGQGLSTLQSAGLTEASMYFFQHHAYDAVSLQVLEQRETEIHVTATVSDDLDGLGIDPIIESRWLSFDGIRASLRSVGSAAEASSRLSEFIDVTGLSCSPGVVAGSFLFRPAD